MFANVASFVQKLGFVLPSSLKNCVWSKSIIPYYKMQLTTLNTQTPRLETSVCREWSETGKQGGKQVQLKVPTISQNQTMLRFPPVPL